MSSSPAVDTSDANSARQLERFAALAVEASLLQHDVRGMLTPALLSADILLTNADPVVARQAEIVIEAINRVVNRVG